MEFDPVPAITGTRLLTALITALNDFVVLLMVKRRRFAGGAAWDDAVCAVLDVKLDQGFEALPIDLAVFERRHQARPLNP